MRGLCLQVTILTLAAVSISGCASSFNATDEVSSGPPASVDALLDHLGARTINMQYVGPLAKRSNAINAEQHIISGDPSVQSQLILYEFASNSEARMALGDVS